ncbi:MAG: glycosyltransferase family 4 protein [Armatimonadota bacterium]|nr:glycosyltransferase family 4 protein [Armatimonadota bacterium]
MASRLIMVHIGDFSGCVTSLRTALRAHVAVEDWDLLSLARRPALAASRLRATVEAYQAGRGVPWVKTRAWSEALQRVVEREGLMTRGPVLFVQTLPAFELDGGAPYAIYTDRVTREGAAAPSPHRSRFAPGWLVREEAFVRGAARIYLMGPSTANVLAREYGVAPDRVAVVGAGPNAVLGPERPSSACRTLLFVGREWEAKGGPELLAAFRVVRREFDDLKLVLAGCRSAGMREERVRCVGPVPLSAMDALYTEADALIHPTHREAVGMVLIEALYKGLPCVGTTAGNQRWVIGEAGLIVEPGRVDALVDALRALIRHYPEFRRRAQARAREVRETFRWEKVAATMVTDLRDGAWGPRQEVAQESSR